MKKITQNMLRKVYWKLWEEYHSNKEANASVFEFKRLVGKYPFEIEEMIGISVVVFNPRYNDIPKENKKFYKQFSSAIFEAEWFSTPEKLQWAVETFVEAVGCKRVKPQNVRPVNGKPFSFPEAKPIRSLTLSELHK